MPDLRNSEGLLLTEAEKLPLKEVQRVERSQAPSVSFQLWFEIILGVRNVHSKKSYRARRLEPGGQQGAGLDDGGVAFWAGGDHADFYLEEVGNEF